MSNRSIEILIVEDHLAMIEGYKTILSLFMSHVTFKFVIATSLPEVKRICEITQKKYDLVLLDISLKKSEEENENSGIEAGLYIRKLLPTAKIVVLTSHVEKLTLYSIFKEVKPEALLIKSEFNSMDLVMCIERVLNSTYEYNDDFKDMVREMNDDRSYLDSVNRKILILINKGIKNKNLSKYLNLSISAIDKRKAAIKESLGIKKGTDEDIIREAKRRGLL